MNFLEYWQYTDFLTKLLFFSLLALSVASWTTGILRFLASKKLATESANIMNERANALKLNDLSTEQKKLLTEQAMIQEINRLRLTSEKGLAILGTTAAIAPFLGLFGTVWSIFHALHAISETGEAGLGQVAGPVGEALIMTGVGLAVAIPAVILYNLCMRMNRQALHLAQDTAHEVIMKNLR